ncbi:hypothetical protein SE17_16880 [Kouleothrix aurantiaca]|uniref:Uncharacterized protein n=1 Tax=Kouleothrix aurantiaca TaxID=186479 RepID=A0A0N8PSA8_9CHLR|nr:hypothetical protein SE17_16880 [Kouleothrix aurantiaca]
MPADNVQANRNALIGLQSLPDYMPANRAYTVERLLEIAQEVERLREEEVRSMAPTRTQFSCWGSSANPNASERCANLLLPRPNRSRSITPHKQSQRAAPH